MAENIAQKTCTPCRGGIPPLTEKEAGGYLSQTPGWNLLEAGHLIRRKFKFADFRGSTHLRRRGRPVGGRRGAPSGHLLRLGLRGNLAADP